MTQLMQCLAAKEKIERLINGRSPKIAVVLGSGLGVLAERVENTLRIPYREIPYFPESTVESHAGELVIGTLAGKEILLMNGRFHYYEGYDFSQVVFAVRVMKLLGVEKLVLTNAAGGVNESFCVGDFMMITDQINLMACGPLRGKHEPAFGPRFFDMSDAYTHSLFPLVRRCAQAAGVVLREGHYFYMPGPQFETPAEIRAIRLLGGDAVGMSTIAEAMAAHQCGMQLIGLSFISNLAAGMTGQKVTDEEVVENGQKSAEQFCRLVTQIVAEW